MSHARASARKCSRLARLPRYERRNLVKLLAIIADLIRLVIRYLLARRPAVRFSVRFGTINQKG